MVDTTSQKTPVTPEPTQLVVSAMGNLFEFFGLKSVVGKVWATILLSEQPIDAYEIRRILQVSSGTASMAIKELMSVGIVYRVNLDGQKKLFYSAESDLWMMATQIFKKRSRERLISILRQLEAAEKALQAEDEDASQSTSEREFRLGQVGRLIVVGKSVIGLLDAIMQRTRVEVVAAQKWLSVSEKLGGEPLSRLRRAINASRMDKRRR